MTNREDSEAFYNNQTENSRVKANIVAKYFPQYAKIIDRANQKSIWYLDLFCGKGQYDDGNFSTPYLITQCCIDDPLLKSKVKLIFNDMYFGEDCKRLLQKSFNLNEFKRKVAFRSLEVGVDRKIREYLSSPVNKKVKNPNPTLMFYDPFGYKAIETTVLSKFMEHWGNEIFLFFNIKRIGAAVKNDKFDKLMRELFPSNFDRLKSDRKYRSSVQDRLQLIIENIDDEFRKSIKGSLYMTAFRFMEEDNSATSHYVLHLTKGIKGRELIKQVYSEYDNIGANLESGTYTFDSKRMGSSEVLLDFGDINAQTLANKIFEKYQGQVLTSQELFNEMQATTLYTGSHFAAALRLLYDTNKITAERTNTKKWQKLIVIGNDCKLIFK